MSSVLLNLVQTDRLGVAFAGISPVHADPTLCQLVISSWHCSLLQITYKVVNQEYLCRTQHGTFIFSYNQMRDSISQISKDQSSNCAEYKNSYE